MRQAGVLAAATHVALDGVEERLTADHENAKIILKGFLYLIKLFAFELFSSVS